MGGTHSPCVRHSDESQRRMGGFIAKVPVLRIPIGISDVDRKDVRMNSRRSNRVLSGPTKAHAIRTYMPRRICADHSCWTVLSIYNEAAYCWVHEPPSRRAGSPVHH